MISPNLGVSKELPCVRDKASKIVKKKQRKMKNTIIGNVLIAIKVTVQKTYLASV